MISLNKRKVGKPVILRGKNTNPLCKKKKKDYGY
jgi:hypothetical protein